MLYLVTAPTHVFLNLACYSCIIHMCILFLHVLPSQLREGTDEPKGTEGNVSLTETEKSPVPSSRSQSRANSEAFVTPQSTPTSSPPPSPSHTPHTSHQHTSQSSSHDPRSSSQEPAVPLHTPATPSNPQRVGDRFPRSLVSSGFESFFSRAPHK